MNRNETHLKSFLDITYGLPHAIVDVYGPLPWNTFDELINVE